MKWPGKMAAEVLRHVTKKPATTTYPAEPAVMPENFRGQIVYSGERCTGCKLCEKDCPSFAIKIVKVGDKRYQAEFDLDKCVYCAQCVDSCNRDCLVSSKDFELAALNRKTLHVVFHAPPPSQPAPSPDKTPATSDAT